MLDSLNNPLQFLKKISTYLLLIVAIFIVSQFMYLLPIHIGAFIFTIMGVIVADLYGLRWIIGQKEVLNEKLLHFLHVYVAHGLIASITSGAIMAYPVAEYLITTPAFLLKLFFVITLAINSFVIGEHVSIASKTPFKTLSKKAKLTLIISGLVSSTAWIGAFMAAQFLEI
jgi:hypothetical protein